LDQLVTLLLLIAAVFCGFHAYKKHVNPRLPLDVQNSSAPLPPSSPRSPAAAATPGASRILVTRTSSIKQWNYGTAGEVNGFLLTNGMLAIVPPALGAQIHSAADIGSELSVAGYWSEGGNRRSIINVQSVSIHGQRFYCSR
jgi:hypothetical protein